MNRLFALVTALLALVANPASALTEREKWNQPAEPFRVIGNVYYVGMHGLSSWLIVTGAGDILIDGDLPESAPAIEQHIKALGFRLSDVKIILNSHAHFDHFGGIAQLKRDTGATFIASAGDRASLETGTYLGSENVKSLSGPPVKVDRLVKDGEVVSLGGDGIMAHLTPGHTRGCTTWTLPVMEAGRLYRVMFFCSTTVAANRLAPREQYPGIVADYRATFAKLKAMQADVFLAPHAEFFDLWGKRARMGHGPNPFVDPGELQRFVARSQADFERQLAAQKAKAGAP
jgi:metallo-beta-lactamase class B